MSAIFLYQNYADQAVLSGGGWLATLPLTNMQDPDIGTVARSVNDNEANTQFTVNMGAKRRIEGVVIGPTNMTPGSTYQIKAFGEVAQTTLLYDSGVRTLVGNTVNWGDLSEWLEWEDPGFWYGILDITQASDFPLYIVEVFPESVDAHIVTVQLNDPANANGYLQFGRLMVTRVYRPTYNYLSGDNAFSAEPLTDVLESLSGLRMYWERGLRRTLRMGFSYEERDIAFFEVFRMSTRSRTSRHVFVIPEINDEINKQERWFLATFRAASQLTQLQLADERVSFAFEFEEVL